MINMKKRREEKGFTQEELANAVGVKRSSIANIECGFNKPSIPVAKKIGYFLDFDWTLLFDDK